MQTKIPSPPPKNSFLGCELVSRPSRAAIAVRSADRAAFKVYGAKMAPYYLIL